MKNVILIICFLVFFQYSNAQHIVTGYIQSASDGKSISGATITSNGQPKQLLTDKNGQFRLKSYNDTLTLKVSFIGYIDQRLATRLPSSEPLVIKLQPKTNQLTEVNISTGYQQIPKDRITGSYTVINKELFNQQYSTNVLDRLESITNGYSLYRGQNGEQRVMIRGMSTIQGVQSPLIIVDNFPYEGDINNVNPNDVENITVLKDAAAAAIWGTKAGNGVIIITTKKGRYNQPMQIDFNTNMTITNKPNLFYLKDISSSDFIDVEKMLFKNGYYTNQIDAIDKPALTPVVELLIKKTNDDKGIDERIEDLKQFDVRNEYNRYMYRNGLKQQYAINLSGGTSKMNWIFSSGYDHNITELDGKQKRINLHYNGSFKPIKNFTISTGIYLTNTKSSSGKPAYGSISTSSGNLYPYAQFVDRDGTALSIMKGRRQAYIDAPENSSLLDWNYYPIEDYKETKLINNIQDVTTNVGLNYGLIKGLSVDLKYQYERQISTGNNFYGLNSYYARNLINTFTSIDQETKQLVHRIPIGAIKDFSNNLLETQQLRGQLNYDHEWGNHSISAIAGGEIRHTQITGNKNRIYGYDDNLLTHGNVDYTKPHPTWITGEKTFIQDNTSISDLENRFVSLYSNVSYTYNDKYTLSASIRRDASNLFGVKTNDKWTPLWSGGTSWEISKEPFYNSSKIPYLKLRFSYGYSGNVDQGRTAVTTMQYVDNSPYTRSPYARFSNYANPELKWEKVGILNLGLDFKTKNDRISGTIEFYKKYGKDLFGTFPVDYTGIPDFTVTRNLASMKATGIDVTLHSKNIDRVITWTTDLNLNFYKDQVTKYYLRSTQGSSVLNGGAQFAGIVGKPVYSVFSYKWAGLDHLTGDPQGIINGEISKDYNALIGTKTLVSDLKYNGPAMPVFSGSLGNTFKWNSLFLTFRITGKFGYYFKKNSISYTSLFANKMGHSDYDLRWKNPGDEQHTHVPSLVYPAIGSRDSFYKNSEVLISKGDHIRLNYITVGYIMNNKHFPFKKLNFNLNASNLGIIWRRNNDQLDPDYFSGNMPATKCFSLGINGSF